MGGSRISKPTLLRATWPNETTIVIRKIIFEDFTFQAIGVINVPLTITFNEQLQDLSSRKNYLKHLILSLTSLLIPVTVLTKNHLLKTLYLQPSVNQTSSSCWKVKWDKTTWPLANLHNLIFMANGQPYHGVSISNPRNQTN